MLKSFIFASLLLMCIKVDADDIPGGYPINTFGCIYPCYYGPEEEQCKEFCKYLGGSYGYCYFYACYCEYLPETVPQLKEQKYFGCSNGQWEITTTEEP
ncbi:neurotoxin Cex9-like [Centruroides sculpturatus]|uniref:neurotoxin Cex9-like n=1 Tax=Centruroides sculpturatus TaxID=218467 RepID=UPI000C6D6FAF|nr:neurotoxin Cex9-like [Centruroides sculpturatus]XP_023243062.1 neurotoxin Cex9-like [Centruroides sculpturatus]